MKSISPMETIGQRLKKRRLEKKLSLDDVYQSIRIRPRVLSALEEDRAEDYLSQVYVKNFLLCYAKFLEMDEGQIVKEYLNSHLVTSSSFSDSFKGVKISFVFKNLKSGIIFILSFIVLLVIIFFIFRSKHTLPTLEEERESLRAVSVATKSAEEIGFPKIEGKQRLTLVLRAKKKVWTQVKSDGKVVFEDVLKKGDIERWLADDSIELWIGDGNALELELNGRHLGSPGTGVIKNVIITRQGMKIGGK